MAVGHLFCVVVFPANLDDQFIGPFVLETHKIELIGMGLAGMPDLIKVRIDPHLPSEHQGVKILLVHPLPYEYRPFQKVGPHVDADLSPRVLGDGQHGLSNVVAAVGDEGELKGFAVPFEPALPYSC